MIFMAVYNFIYVLRFSTEFVGLFFCGQRRQAKQQEEEIQAEREEESQQLVT
jgi:hypothetical protein